MSQNKPLDPVSPIEPSAFQPLDASAPEASGQRHPLRWVVGGCALLFLMIMAFLLTSRSLQITVIAESPASIDIDGLALPFGDRYLLRPGEYQVSATAEGYHPFSTAVTVSDSDSQTAELVLKPLPGLITIESQPAGARVIVDDQHLGNTP